MTRAEFMGQLGVLLLGLPAEEREDALRYYQDFLDAAGPGNEAATLAELGSPEAVAEKILSDHDAAVQGEPKAPPPPPEPPRAPEPPAYEAPPPQDEDQYGYEPPRRRHPLVIVAFILAVVLLVGSVGRLVSYLIFGIRDFSNVASSSLVRTVQADSSAPAAGNENAASQSTTTGGIEIFEENYSAADVRDLSLSIASGPTTIVYSDAVSDVALSATYDAIWGTFSAELTSDGVLQVKYDQIQKNSQKTLGPDEQTAFTLTLPTDFVFPGKAALEMGLGDTTIGVLQADRITIDSGVGDIQIDALQADKITLESGIGDIQIDALQAANAKISSGVGTITGTSIQADDLSLETGVGGASLSLAGTEADYTFTGDSGLGGVTIGGRSLADGGLPLGAGPGTVELTAGIGSIEIAFEK